jgi:hypothetical protein
MTILKLCGMIFGTYPIFLLIRFETGNKVGGNIAKMAGKRDESREYDRCSLIWGGGFDIPFDRNNNLEQSGSI